MRSTSVSNTQDQTLSIPRESIVSEQHGRAIYLEVIALSSHRGRVPIIRVGEVRPMITIHYAVHVAHVHQLAGAVYTPVTHTYTRARNLSAIWAYSRASYMYVNTHTVAFISFDISSSLLSIGANDVKIRIRAPLRDIAPGSDGHSTRPCGTIFLEKTCEGKAFP